MKIAWLGHHCYRIRSDSGLTIITDPYLTPFFSEMLMGDFRYDPLNESADIVTISHDQHRDHNNAAAIKGKTEIVRGSEIRGSSKKVKGIEFKAIPCYHDNVQGALHGESNMIYFKVDGMKICHTGDLGHELTADQVAELGKIDVLLLAVGYPGRDPRGFHYRIDANVADALYYRLKPRVTLPGHYANQKCTFRLAILDEFLDGKTMVTRADTSEVEFKKDQLPEHPEIIVLKSVY